MCVAHYSKRESWRAPCDLLSLSPLWCSQGPGWASVPWNLTCCESWQVDGLWRSGSCEQIAVGKIGLAFITEVFKKYVWSLVFTVGCLLGFFKRLFSCLGGCQLACLHRRGSAHVFSCLVSVWVQKTSALYLSDGLSFRIQWTWTFRLGESARNVENTVVVHSGCRSVCCCVPEIMPLVSDSKGLTKTFYYKDQLHMSRCCVNLSFWGLRARVCPLA